MGEEYAFSVYGNIKKGKSKKAKEVLDDIVTENYKVEFKEPNLNIDKDGYFSLNGQGHAGYTYVLHGLKDEIAEKLNGLVEDISIEVWHGDTPQSKYNFREEKADGEKKLQEVV